MRRLLIALAFCANAFAFGGLQNWNGMKDTATVFVVSTGSDTSTCFPLWEYEDLRLFVGINDTGDAGYGSDSANIAYWYETGCEVMNDTGGRDTAWATRVVVDSMLQDSFGIEDPGVADTTGAIHYNPFGGRADTLSVTGWAFQYRRIIPEPDCFIRFGATGLSRNGKTTATKVRFAIIRRTYMNTRDR